jgi:hypothetical protein
MAIHFMQKPLFVVFLLVSLGAIAQQQKAFDRLDAGYFYGSILRHNKDIGHLIRAHTQGVVLSYNRKTFGDKRWQRTYNYPEWGVSFVFQDGGYAPLGSNYGLYAHANFFFIKRMLMLRVGQGIAYASNPFDLEDNFKNNAYGSRLLSSTYLQLGFKKENIFKRIGLQAGIHLLHYSNANFRAPNSSTNAFNFYLGLNYNLNEKQPPEFTRVEEEVPVRDKIRFNFVLRGGLNESDYLSLGQHPFAVVSAYADKRLNYTSSLLFGVDVFFAEFLDREIDYLVASGLDTELSGDEDYRRVGVFVGHQLHFNRLSLIGQLGYYLYYPYDFEGRTYIRAGLKYMINDRLFPVITLKSHGAKVEAMEFGFGIRL